MNHSPQGIREPGDEPGNQQDHQNRRQGECSASDRRAKALFIRDQRERQSKGQKLCQTQAGDN